MKLTQIARVSRNERRLHQRFPRKSPWHRQCLKSPGMKRFRCIGPSGGFTFMELLVVIAIVAILMAAFLPALMKTRAHPSQINCGNNLKQVGLSFQQWSLDNGGKFPMQVSVTNGGTMELISSGNVFLNFLVMSNELNTPKILCCRGDEERLPASSFTTNFDDANISYFVGVDAVGSSPNMLLCGDDNLAMGSVLVKRGLLTLSANIQVSWTAARHKNKGNILLADGSVQGFSNSRLREALQNTGVATNRLLIP